MAIKKEAARKLNTDLYSALIKGEAEKVVQMCRRIPEGPLHTLTIHQDTVLHVATHSKQKNLVIDLLNLVPEDHYDRLTGQNDSGNTILAEAAASDKMVPAAIVMLHKAPMLLSLPNRRGETPIFRAARYGKKDMYKLLDAEMHKAIQNGADLRSHHFRDDKASTLHISVLAEHFGLDEEFLVVATLLSQLGTSCVSERAGISSCRHTVIMIVCIIRVAKASLEKALEENGELEGIDLVSPGLPVITIICMLHKFLHRSNNSSIEAADSYANAVNFLFTNSL